MIPFLIEGTEPSWQQLKDLVLAAVKKQAKETFIMPPWVQMLVRIPL